MGIKLYRHLIVRRKCVSFAKKPGPVVRIPIQQRLPKKWVQSGDNEG